MLNDGRLLCTFARHTLLNGIFAIISSDRGDTWDTDNPIYLVGSHPELFGTWQHDLQLPDGTMRSAWARFYGGPPTFEIVHWELR